MNNDEANEVLAGIDVPRIRLPGSDRPPRRRWWRRVDRWHERIADRLVVEADRQLARLPQGDR
jgi:hypothetical protein